MFELALPNVLTVVRILLVPVLVAALLSGAAGGDLLAAVVFAVAALVSLVSLDRLSAWVAMVIIAREFAVTGLRQLAMEDGHVIPASAWGKVKTIVQIAMVLVLIAVDERTAAVDALVYLTVVVTVISGADYFFNFRSRLRAHAAGRERRA